MRRWRSVPLLLWACAAAGFGEPGSATAAPRTIAPDTRGLCDEARLKRAAVAVLSSHYDVELGAVAAGDSAHVGFQYMKPAEALFAAQALAHDDFVQASTHFQNVFKYQRADGLLPHLVYGPSVKPALEWIPSNQTFHPGPAFWNAAEPPSKSRNQSRVVATSTLLAPPVAADVAWQIFRLAPYDAVLGVVSYKTAALQFLCNTFEPLKRLHGYILTNRSLAGRDDEGSRDGRLAAHHPWETLSSLSPHWKALLAKVKTAPDYDAVIASIPETAKQRFAAGAFGAGWSTSAAIEDMYEPMIYLASSNRSRDVDSAIDDNRRETVKDLFAIADVEFNALVLKSALSLVSITRVLAEHSSVCTDFSLSKEEMVNELGRLRKTANRLQDAIVGTNETIGFWNSTTKFFNDADTISTTSVFSLRGVMPAYASELPESRKMGLVEHFLTPVSTFGFFCAKFPAPFFGCSDKESGRRTTWMLYDYFLQRTFSTNGFPGIAEFVRNKTRDMVCATATTSSPRTPSSGVDAPSYRVVLSPAYDSDTGAAPFSVFDDGYIGSTLAAATFLNILLPAVTAPPSPDQPPVDHRMLTVIMCVELVVAFAVAIGCVFFSVYFVVNRPRDRRLASWNGDMRNKQRRRSRARSDRRGGDSDVEDGQSMGSWRRQYSVSSLSDDGGSYSSVSGQDREQAVDLEEALLSDDDEHAYGAIEQQEPVRRTMTSSAWESVKEALAAISPW